jgi:hypothetical protein
VSRCRDALDMTVILLVRQCLNRWMRGLRQEDVA